MSPTGFSTSCLRFCRPPISLAEKIKIYLSAGATAVELGAENFKKPADFELPQNILKQIAKFAYLSVHVSFKPEAEPFSKKTVEKLRRLCAAAPIRGIVLHPQFFKFSELSELEKTGLPFLIENMDPRKNFGRLPEEIEKIKNNFNFGFVFDLQHIYQNDPGINLAKEMLGVMGNRLKHLHVSGQNSQISHVALSLADNRKQILEILKITPGVPRISEGKIFQNPRKSLLAELKLIKNAGEKNNPVL